MDKQDLQQDARYIKREVGRGYLNGWGTILAYATVGVLALLVLPTLVKVEPIQPDAGGCGCGSQ